MSKEKEFNIKCICDWSKNCKYGFIPHADCKAHGYRVRKLKQEKNNGK